MNPQPRTILGAAEIWPALSPLALPTARRLRQRLPSADAPGPENAGFDILRTRVLGVVADQGWRRIGIVQPCGRSAGAFAALNLALSIARRPSLRVLLADLDLARPRLASMLGLQAATRLAPLLREGADLVPALRGIGPNFAVLVNAMSDPLASETLQEPGCGQAIDRLIAALDPDIALLLLPPLLDGDAGLAGLPLIEAGLMVLDGQHTTPDQVRECERLDDGDTPMIGLFLAEAEA